MAVFGEHLLNGNDKPVAIVESEKTAIIASVYLPKYIWIATGTKTTLKLEYAKSLKGRTVILYPDIGAFDDWNKKAESLDEICSVSISDLLERKADPEAKREGYDLADYLTQFDISEFRAISNPSPPKERGLERKYESQKNPVLTKNGYPAEWDEIQLISESQAYKEATMQALSDCDTDFERLQIKDPKVAKLVNLFDAELI